MKNNRRIITFFLVILLFVVFIVIPSINNSEKIQNRFLLDFDSYDYKQNERIVLDEIETYHTFELIDEGEDVFIPRKMGYRYGPSIIYYDDGTMDAWFASNGSSGQWDWITYRHYDGQGWSNEEVVLKPTRSSLDHYSVCDPGVIYFNNYYYLGYTSTTNSKGVENNIFVARSSKPNGPYEKWNGEGWGGNPKPIITYDENDSGWGVGEVSFVIVEDKLYCYYSWINNEKSLMKLAIGDLSDNWPNTLEEKGEAISKINCQDSCDVVYAEEYQKYIALCVEARFSDESCIAVYESDDGLSFKQVDRIEDNVHKQCHNMGLSKKINGHINSNDDLIIGYAYSRSSNNTWGRWSTKFHKAKLKTIYKKVEDN